MSAKLSEYELCQVRDHESNGVISGHENYAEYTCKFCGVRYYFTEPKLVEIDPPKSTKKKGTLK